LTTSSWLWSGHSVSYLSLSSNWIKSSLGADYFDDRQRDHVQRRLVHRLERLGYVVTLAALTTSS